MKQKTYFQAIIIALLLYSGQLYSQILVEASYTRAFLDTKNLGNMSAPNIFEIGAGWSGHGIIPYGGFTLGYMDMNDKEDIGQSSKLAYRSLMFGGKLGCRPFATIWESPFQPIIQASIKTTFTITTENKDTGEKEQLFSNGITKVYDPAKITFITGSAGFEYYLKPRFAIVVLGNYDFVQIEKNKFNNYSASLGIRQNF